MKRSNPSGRCAACGKFVEHLYAVPDDEPVRDGRVRFRYVCRACWHNLPDPFDDPDTREPEP